MKIKLQFIIILIIILISGCNNTVNKKTYSYTPPAIPAIIETPEHKKEYLTNHFWDNLPWNDTTIIIDQALISNHFYKYLNLLRESNIEKLTTTLFTFASKCADSHYQLSQLFFNLFEESLYHPNSPMRHDKLYLAVLNAYIESENADSMLKERALFNRSIVNKNNIGDIAEDFDIFFTNGTKSSLHNIKSLYTLIFFFEPGCPSCMQNQEYISKSEIYNRFISRYKFIAIYTGDDIESYKFEVEKYPKGWLVGYDINNSILINNLYDRRASPSIYILDKEKRVILKDGDAVAAEAVLQKLLDI